MHGVWASTGVWLRQLTWDHMSGVSLPIVPWVPHFSVWTLHVAIVEVSGFQKGVERATAPKCKYSSNFCLHPGSYYLLVRASLRRGGLHVVGAPGVAPWRQPRQPSTALHSHVENALEPQQNVYTLHESTPTHAIS